MGAGGVQSVSTKVVTIPKKEGGRALRVQDQMKRFLSLFLSLALVAALLCPAALAVNEAGRKDSDWLYITLDPGHGGNGAGGSDSGAVSSTYGYHEADLVLKIGLYLKQELETYRHVHVDMTRSDSYGTSATAPLSKVENRVLFAAEKNSDLLVSLHLNSSASKSPHGAEVLASNGNYRSELADVIDGVGTKILTQLGMLGIQNRGLVKKSSQDGTTYPNGKLADYYGIVRYGVKNNIPSMIVEHCFISNDSECQQFLSSDAKLQALAQADARGIAAFYGLEKKVPGEPDDPEPMFIDCHNHWGRSFVEHAAENGWVGGIGNGRFDPNGTLTRGAFVTMLAAFAGVKTSDYPASSFSDVHDGQWFARGVAWAAAENIVGGYPGNIFDPNRNITRQEMAAIMTKYLAWKGVDTTPAGDLDALNIADRGDIADWAAQSVCFCYENKLLSGRGSGFAPLANATRAEACVVLKAMDGFLRTTDG